MRASLFYSLRRVAAGGVTLAMVGAPGLAGATSTVQVHANVYQNYDSSGIPAAVNRQTAAAGAGRTQVADAVLLQTAGPSAQTAAGATALATEGRLSVKASGGAQLMTGHYDSRGNAYMPSQGAWASAETWARWSDQVTISDPARAGQPGTAMAMLDLSGLVGANSSPFANVRNPDGSFLYQDSSGYARVTVSGNGLNWTTQTWDDACAAVGWGGWLACSAALANDPTGRGTYQAGSIGVLPVVVDFVFGRPFALSYTLTASAGGTAATSYYRMSASGGGAGNADMSHTLLWGGISGVFDQSGANVNDFGLSSASGFDYRVAAVVPEPASVALMLSGLAVLASVLRRRGARRVSEA